LYYLRNNQLKRHYWLLVTDCTFQLLFVKYYYYTVEIHDKNVGFNFVDTDAGSGGGHNPNQKKLLAADFMHLNKRHKILLLLSTSTVELSK
jgi:hypothetical protein